MPPSPPFDVSEWLFRHPTAALALGAFCVWVSVCFIVRMWVTHRRASATKKLIWSLMLLVPLFGWLSYVAWFQPPDYTDIPCPPNSDAMTGGGGHF